MSSLGRMPSFENDFALPLSGQCRQYLLMRDNFFCTNMWCAKTFATRLVVIA